jgi:CRISPR/Cas system-associated exonuclease Cas4 (RecB family)
MPWEFVPEYFPFGRSIHEAVTAFYRTLKETDQRISLDDLINHFRESWDRESQGKIRFKENHGRDSLRAKGVQMLEVFYENIRPQRILGVEVPFSVDLLSEETGEVLPYELTGIFDLVESDEEGNQIMVELKTGSKRFTDDQIDLDLQGTLYAYALSQIGFCTRGSDTLVRYDLLLKSKKPALESYFAVRGNAHYVWAFQLVRKVARAIDLEVFYPVPGWQCKDCPFGRACKNKN